MAGIIFKLAYCQGGVFPNRSNYHAQSKSRESDSLYLSPTEEQIQMFNRKVFSLALLMAILIGSTISAQAAPSAKPDPIGPVEVSSAVYSDVSGPLSDLVGVAPDAPEEKEKKEKPIRSLPNMGNALNQDDGAVQTVVGPLAGTTSGLNFAGVGQ